MGSQLPMADLRDAGAGITLPELAILRAESKALSCPNFPKKYIPVKKYSDKTANGLTECVVDCINLSGGFAFRCSSTGLYREGIGWTPSNSIKGLSDVIGIYKGLFLGVEIKTTDSMSQHQKEFQKRVEAAGGKYFLCRGFNSFSQWFYRLQMEVNK